MIELGRHIEILLLKSDCVIVPGLGGFVARHVAARYDDGDRMFIPPLRTLGFNPKLSINDSLLVQSYSDAYDISFPDAFSRIEGEVEELKQHLQNTGSYELNNIGLLYHNDEGRIEFKPCEAGILTPGLYGLSSFDMEERVHVGDNPCVSVEFASNYCGMSLRHETAVDAIGGKKSAGKQDSDRSVQIKISALRNLVAAVIAVVLFLVLGTPVNEGAESVNANSVVGSVVDRIVHDGYNNVVKSANRTRPAVLLKDTASANVKAAKASLRVSSGKAVTKTDARKLDKDKYYCIVLASQVSKKNAQAFVAQLKDDGFDDARVYVGANRSVKVVYGCYGSQNDAYNELNNLRNNEYFYEAWVYQVKN